MNKIENDICKTQAELFQYITKHKYNFEEFVNNYMNSKFCNNEMDSNYSRFHFEFPEECIDFFDFKLKLDAFANEDIIESDAYLIGYIYRYLFFKYQISSSQLIKKYPFLVIKTIVRNYYNEDIEEIINQIEKNK